MLDAVDLDAVYVALPPFAHGEIEHAVIDAGKAILVEKPLAIDMGVARAIDAHIREAGVINSVGYQGRYGALGRPGAGGAGRRAAAELGLQRLALFVGHHTEGDGHVAHPVDAQSGAGDVLGELVAHRASRTL